MTHEEIKDLISFLDEKASINRLKIKDKDFELEIKKEDAACANATISAPAPACTPAPSVNVVLSEKPATNKINTRRQTQSNNKRNQTDSTIYTTRL